MNLYRLVIEFWGFSHFIDWDSNCNRLLNVEEALKTNCEQINMLLGNWNFKTLQDFNRGQAKRLLSQTCLVMSLMLRAVGC